MDNIDSCGRVARTITSEAGLKAYYEHLNHWRVCYGNTNPLVVPTQAEALEYLKLQEEKNSFFFCNDQDSRIKKRLLEVYETQYDWRPRKSGQETSVGIISPTGEQLLPNSFADIFTQFDAINDKPEFIPVSDGQAWGLVSSTTPPVLMTDFKYNAIIPERWERKLFFIQDKATRQWGALEISHPFCHTTHCSGSLPLLQPLMPPIADEIYEDELMTDDEPLTFFVIRREDKIGILTRFGYSDIAFDSYEADSTKCTFRLIRHNRKRARLADYWHPDPTMYAIYRRNVRATRT